MKYNIVYKLHNYTNNATYYYTLVTAMTHNEVIMYTYVMCKGMRRNDGSLYTLYLYRGKIYCILYYILLV